MSYSRKSSAENCFEEALGYTPQHFFSDTNSYFILECFAELSTVIIKLQGDSKLLSEFPWPIIFKPEATK
jgi:hypothetical protein